MRSRRSLSTPSVLACGVLLFFGCGSDDAEKDAGTNAGGSAGSGVGGSGAGSGASPGGSTAGGSTGVGGSSVGGTTGGGGGAALECMQASWLCACAPGETRSCDCGGFNGTQQCNPSGTAFLSCDCSGAGGSAGGGGSGIDEDCCAPHPTPGCDNSLIEECVCGFDPLCCTTSWDEACVELTAGLECAEGYCSEPVFCDPFLHGCPTFDPQGGTPCCSSSTTECGFDRGFGCEVGSTALPSLGNECFSDGDCGGSPFQCVSPGSGVWNGAWPPGGLCTVSCDGDPSACDRYAPGSICVDFGGTDPLARICLETCSFGPQGATSFDPTKCHGRDDMACGPTMGVPNVCLPVCATDEDCVDGFCHGDGLCRPPPPVGDPIGSACTSSDPTCAGICQPFPNGPGGPIEACTSPCTLGATFACGWTNYPSTPAPAACTFIPTANSTPGYGDAGQCAQTCNCTLECANPAFACIEVPTPSFQFLYGAVGICGPPLGPDGMPSGNELTACP